MLRYEQVSGVVFSLVSLGQLGRALMALPAQVGTVQIPVWLSYVAFVVTASLAVWAFRSSGAQNSPQP